MNQADPSYEGPLFFLTRGILQLAKQSTMNEAFVTFEGVLGASPTNLVALHGKVRPLRSISCLRILTVVRRVSCTRGRTIASLYNCINVSSVSALTLNLIHVLVSAYAFGNWGRKQRQKRHGKEALSWCALSKRSFGACLTSTIASQALGSGAIARTRGAKCEQGFEEDRRATTSSICCGKQAYRTLIWDKPEECSECQLSLRILYSSRRTPKGEQSFFLGVPS